VRNSDLSVLIVDDDPTCLYMLQAILEETGFRVTAADRPRAALRQVQTRPPDILVTDLRMPEMSGLDLVRAVRTVADDVYCLVVTGFASDEVTAEAYGAGVRDLLTKPINVAEVQARVENGAELVRLRREVRRLREAQAASAIRASDVETPPRARELADLPALPGSAAPVEVTGRDDTLHRLERLGALFRQGILGVAEFEEKKRALLARV
jgi:DNA-binding response OmpR family regulator